MKKKKNRKWEIKLLRTEHVNLLVRQERLRKTKKRPFERRKNVIRHFTGIYLSIYMKN